MTHKKTIYFSVFTNKIWSYLLWPPVIVCYTRRTDILPEDQTDQIDDIQLPLSDLVKGLHINSTDPTQGMLCHR